MTRRQVGIALLCVLTLITVPVAVTAADFDVTTDETINVVDRTVEQGGNTFEVTEVTQVDPSDQITVNVDAPDNADFNMYMYDENQTIVPGGAYEGTGSTDFDVSVEDRAPEPGTYAFVVQSDGVNEVAHPVIVRGYSVSADPPGLVTEGDSIAIDGEFSQLRGEEYNKVEIVVASTDTDKQKIVEASVDGESFSASIPTDELGAGSYDAYAVVRGSNTVFGGQEDGQKEILGLSSPQLIEIEATESDSDTDDSDGSDGGGGGGGGGGAPADTTDDSETSEPPAQESLGDGPVTRSVTDAEPDEGGVNVEVNAGPVGRVSFDAPDDAASGEMTVSQSESTTEAFTSQFGTDQVKTAVSITVPDELADTAAVIQFNLTADELGETAPEDLQVVKNADGGSQVLSMSTTERDDGGVVITARTPGFSEFAVIEDPAESSSTGDSNETTAEESTDSDGTDADGGDTSETSTDGSTETTTPGFGPLVAFVALLAAALFARYRR